MHGVELTNVEHEHVTRFSRVNVILPSSKVFERHPVFHRRARMLLDGSRAIVMAAFLDSQNSS